MSVRLCAYAKVNLMLAVGPKRKDGYHEVATLLQAISLHDVLTFRPRAKGFALAVRGPESRGVPRGASNLVLRAARLLQAELGETRGAAITLEKHVPHGAGLGGGSSDAAATLVGLLRLWRRRLPKERLAALAARLGSDVPFFLGPGRAFARGRGEILTPLPALRKPLRMVVVVPQTRVSTREAYANHLIPKSRLTGWARAVNLVQLRSFRAFGPDGPKSFFNDLEGSVLRRHPAIRAARDRLLKNGAVVALMSGSGSGVVGFTSGSTPPRVVAARLSRIDGKVFIARSVRAGSNSCRVRPRVSGKTPYRHTL
jgi:4-diphosphocytidyl-2-C-methyl-D-erythritol kinase